MIVSTQQQDLAALISQEQPFLLKSTSLHLP